MLNYDKITVHTSATKPGANVNAAVIRHWHKNKKPKGWSDIGYHFVIPENGELEIGRPLERMGAHVKGFNKNNIGICLVGGLDDKDKPSFTFNKKQMETLRLIIDTLRFRFNIPVINVKGHRDYSPDKNKDGVITKDEWLKVCPCFDVGEWYNESRSTDKDQNRKPEVEEQKTNGMDQLRDTSDSNDSSSVKVTTRKRRTRNTKPK